MRGNKKNSDLETDYRLFEPASRAEAPDIPNRSKSDVAKLRKEDEIEEGLQENYNSLTDNPTYRRF